MRNVQFQRDVRRGFSLIEIMVAVTLLTVITVGLLAMFYHTQRAFRIGTSQVDVLEGGRAALRMVALDLQEMYPSRVDLVRNFQAVTNRAAIRMPLPGGDEMTNLLQDVTFLTRRGNEWSAISYRVDPMNGAGTLYRAVIPMNMTNLLSNTNMTPADQRIAISNLFRDATRPVVAPFDDPANPPFDRIADGVVHFRVHAFDDRGIRFDQITNDYSKKFTNKVFAFWFTNWVPEYVDVELAILDPKAMKQMQAREDRPTVAEDYLQRQGYRTHFFHQRVQIRSRREEFDLFAGP
jgi:prepilin-type N-terminal cleavage/methylation domain-containing protein